MSPWLAAAIVVVGLACPAHSLWHWRRGRRAACCPSPEREDDATEVQRRQQELRANLDALADSVQPDKQEHPGYAVRR